MSKKRLSVSIDEDLADRVDELVDGLVIKSRSEAMEKLLREQLKNRRTAVILAGGEPEELKIEGMDLYRPLVRIGERRLIEDQILKVREAGFHNVAIVGHPRLIEDVYDVLGDGNGLNVSIRYLEEREPKGTGKTLEKVSEFVNTDFLFLPADHYFDFDLRKIFDFHREQGGTATIGVHNLTNFDYESGGFLEMDGVHVIDYEEDPEEPKTHMLSTFMGYCRPEVFDHIPPGDVSWSLQEHVFPKLAEERELVGYPVSGNWVNIHTKEDVDLARELAEES